MKQYLPLIIFGVAAFVAIKLLNKRKPTMQIQDPLLSGSSSDLIQSPAATPGALLHPTVRQAVTDISTIPTLQTTGGGGLPNTQ